MKPLLYHPAVEAEIESDVAYYESRRQGLGGNFRREIDRLLPGIQQDPSRWPRFRGVRLRYRPLRRFPFAVIFEDRADCVFVVAVAHQKRKPSFWLPRVLE